MTKDKALEELFLAQKPQFDDHDAFMARLNRRLDAVEFVKQHQEAVIRRYRMAMVVTFVVGIVCGGVSVMWLLSSPLNVPLFTFSVQIDWLMWLAENSRLIIAGALSLFMTLSIISIINNVMEIISSRQSLLAR
ncbi:MAG: hypothetical protein J6X76_00210 [Bacteroidaceae bacterium]|nr:hypothetical protein [Bacteroidaceae bacterium]